MDPYLGSAFDPISLHQYLYARNDPPNRIDPSGKQDYTLVSLSAAVSINDILGQIAFTHITFGIITAKIINVFFEPGFAARNGALTLMSESEDPNIWAAAQATYAYGIRLIEIGASLIQLTGAITDLAKLPFDLGKDITDLVTAPNAVAAAGAKSLTALDVVELTRKAGEAQSAGGQVVGVIRNQPESPGLLERLKLPTNEWTESLKAFFNLASCIEPGGPQRLVSANGAGAPAEG